MTRPSIVHLFTVGLGKKDSKTAERLLGPSPVARILLYGSPDAFISAALAAGIPDAHLRGLHAYELAVEMAEGRLIEVSPGLVLSCQAASQ